MPSLRSIAGAALRIGLNIVQRTGVSLFPSRDRANRITGVRAQWREEEGNQFRGLVIEREIDGRLLRFFISDESDSIQQMHMSGRWYEEEELKLIASHYSGGTFVDVGSNVGNHSLFVAITLGARVIAFEPNPPAYKNCHYNFLLNGIDGRATVRRLGLSDKSDTARVGNTPYRNLGASKLVTGDGPLTLRRGDDILMDEKIGFIKIDVEGMEIAVLRGLEEIIKLNRPNLMVEVDDASSNAFTEWAAAHRYAIAEKLPKWGNVNYLMRPR